MNLVASSQLWGFHIENNEHFVFIELEALKTINEWRQYERFKQDEACGVLLGERRGAHLRIMLATPPQTSDERKPAWYQRNPQGHQAIVNFWHQKSHGTIQYLGEWHTHPEIKPSPSPKDYIEWTRTGKVPDFNHQLMIFFIAGIESHWLGVMLEGVLYKGIKY
ncbi:hypothetical protein FK216_12430 [Moraxellaceae bacterium AER2_44_116]|nr:hypothetical protein FK216_12430 [Moraxellaceae bacterium AER2_44_116]